MQLGPEWEKPFWNSDFRLRFELSDGGYSGRYVTKFMVGLDRARRLVRMALRGEQPLAVITALNDPAAELGAEHKRWTTGTAWEHLAAMGVTTDEAVTSWRDYWWMLDEGDPEIEPMEQRAVRLSWEQADILIWNQVAQDLGIMPQAPVYSKFVDLERRVCVSVYDDRGMDVTALDRATLASLYVEGADWLLDYDRERMVQAFEG